MKTRLACVACVTASFAIGAGTRAQPVTLHEEGLADITAASATRSASQAVSGAGSRAPTATASAQHPLPSGVPREVIVAAGGVLVVDATNAVLVADGAQANTRAMNVTNAAQSGVAQGINVFDQRATQVRDAPEFAAEQSNRFSQTSEPHGGGGDFAFGEFRHSQSDTWQQAQQTGVATQRTEMIDRHVSSRSTTTTLSATVDPVHVGLFDEPVSLAGGQSIALPTFTLGLPSTGVAFTIGEPDTWFSVDVDLTLTFPQLTVSGARLDLGSVSLHRDDVVIATPSLTLPELTFGFCFRPGGCNDDQVATVTLPGRTISLPETRLEGTNPLGALGIEFGYAVAGDGSITFSAGSLDLTGEIPLAPSIAVDFDIVVPVYGNVHTLSHEVSLPEFIVPVDLHATIDPPAGFNRAFAGEACTFGAGQDDCRPLDVTRTQSERTEYSRTDGEQRSSSSSESRNSVSISRSTAEVRVLTGQAELVVLAGSGVEASHYNVVIVDGGAQSRATTLNTVNASATVVGNAVNVTAGRAVSLPDVPASARLSQTNIFNQIGIR